MPNDSTDTESRSDTYTDVASAENIDTDQWVQVNQAHYDRESDGELATKLIFTIADTKDVDPLNYDELPPLYESIDAQTLEETFFGPSGAETERDESGAVEFRYIGYKVVLRADGWIFVYEPE
jgi:hypothetical protein